MCLGCGQQPDLVTGLEEEGKASERRKGEEGFGRTQTSEGCTFEGSEGGRRICEGEGEPRADPPETLTCRIRVAALRLLLHDGAHLP